jgi:hypothetical protein
MIKYTVLYHYAALVTVEAKDKYDALQKASEVEFSVLTENPEVCIEYMDGYDPEVYEEVNVNYGNS